MPAPLGSLLTPTRHDPPQRPRRARVARPAIVAGAMVLSTVAAVTVASTASAAPRDCTQSGVAVHQVARGDTWFGISGDLGVSMGSLLDANGASASDVIHPGDELCLPAGAAASRVTSSGKRECNRSSAATTTVRDGDGWFRIASRSGTSTGALLEANTATADTVLHVGDVLCLPAGANPGSAPSTASAAASATQLAAAPLHGPCWYGDTWGAPRGNGRRHEGVDLLAHEGKYVYAVVDGTLTRRWWDQPGRLAGNAWFLTSADGSGTYYFYAHLADFAPGLEAGSRVEAGEIIGFVGSTGNSAAPHLHFEIHPNGGPAVSPYQTVRAVGGCKTGTGYQQPSGWVPEG
jgi:murein DD-endopeptidase MepM/ murein hydrolase activator NlpD